MTTDDQNEASLLDRLPIPRRLLMPAVISLGLLGGVLAGALFPPEWVLVPAEAAQAMATNQGSDGGQKEYYA